MIQEADGEGGGAPDPGRAIVLRAGEVEATVHPDVGGRLGQIEVRGQRLLADYRPRADAWACWGSYVLAPWSNRIAGGRFSFAGHEWTMPALAEDGSALHGLVHSKPWGVDLVDRSARVPSAALAVAIEVPPFSLIARQRFSLGPDALRHEVSLENVGHDPVPVGLGIHPWFRAGPTRVLADMIWPTTRAIPMGPPRPLRAGEDLRTSVLPPPMDSCYTGLTGRTAEIGGVTLSWDGPVTNVVVFTGEPGWIAVEPVTNANDGFNLQGRGLDAGVLILVPGASEQVTYTYRWPGL